MTVGRAIYLLRLSFSGKSRQELSLCMFGVSVTTEFAKSSTFLLRNLHKTTELNFLTNIIA